MREHLRVRAAAVGIVAVALLLSCSASSTHLAVDRLPLGRPGCSPPSPLGVAAGGGLPETRGTATGGAQLYGLVMPEAGLPLRVGEQIKIVWRMTGHGPLVATLTSPSGAPTPLTFGPAAHLSSSYNRPGDEWGTGYLFTDPGCWHLHFARDDAAGDAWFRIVT
jgi:hypothetical protein